MGRGNKKLNVYHVCFFLRCRSFKYCTVINIISKFFCSFDNSWPKDFLPTPFMSVVNKRTVNRAPAR